MKSQRSLSRFPLVLAGALVSVAVGFMAYLSTLNPMPTVTQMEREISLEGLAAQPQQMPQSAPKADDAAPKALPLPAQDSE